MSGESGMVNAPTGSGKTYSLLLPAIARGLQEPAKGCQIIWITPIRALAKEIAQSAERAVQGMGSDWRVEIRTGDTSQKIKQRQKKELPEILITTPESIHVMFTQKGHEKLFKHLQAVVLDEWHELMGSKRAVQCELLLARFRALNPA